MTIRIILKNGIEIPMKCKEFSVTEGRLSGLTQIEWEGATENKLLYIDLSQVVAMFRVMSDEEPEEA